MQLEFLNGALEELDAERAALTAEPQTAMGRDISALPTLRGIGPIGTWTLATEIFGWRQIKNGRQLGGLVGLVPARIRAARAHTIKASRARAISMCVASWCNSPGAGSGTSRTAP
jgi:transposase